MASVRLSETLTRIDFYRYCYLVPVHPMELREDVRSQMMVVVRSKSAPPVVVQRSKFWPCFFNEKNKYSKIFRIKWQNCQPGAPFMEQLGEQWSTTARQERHLWNSWESSGALQPARSAIYGTAGRAVEHYMTLRSICWVSLSFLALTKFALMGKFHSLALWRSPCLRDPRASPEGDHIHTFWS